MSKVPTSSAVLLLHNPHGGFPIAAAAGSLSGQACHAVAYDGRKDRFAEKGGCDRDETRDDRALARARGTSDDADRFLDYDARQGAWSGKGDGAMEDCSYWGQGGPLSREEIERDMLACGGSFVKSVVSVDRRYAAELELDSKEAFQRLIRANWRDMMVAAGVADSPEGVHWYACYHTDAENSLHVHIATWAADGRISEGWHPSARATREQKAMLYRDAYAPLRMQRNLEQDYYRMLLPKLAALEMGDRVGARSAERLRRKAAAAGVEEVPLKRTVDEAGRDEISKRADAVASRLGEERGLKSRDWKLQSDAGKVVRAIESNSPAFAGALARYRELVEAKADMAGLAVSSATHGHGLRNGEGEPDVPIVQRERNRFVRREMDDVMRRIRNQVIRSADPAARERSLVREPAPNSREQSSAPTAPATPLDLVGLVASTILRERSMGPEAGRAASRNAKAPRQSLADPPDGRAR